MVKSNKISKQSHFPNENEEDGEVPNAILF